MATMKYSRPLPVVVSEDSETFAPWVRALGKKSGVYVIYIFDVCEYVGSSIGNLYGTLTRHVQDWTRRQSSEFTGYVFNRHDILVSVLITSPEDARAYEQMAIDDLEPRLNRNSPALARENGKGFLEELDEEIEGSIPF